MSTRSNIGIYDAKAGTVEYVFCHWDGYIECVGQRLLGFYDTEQKVRSLLSHGGVESLKNSPEISVFFDKDIDGAEKVTVKVSSVGEAASCMRAWDIEFIYVFDVDSNSWVYAENKSDGNLRLHPIPKRSDSFVWSDPVTIQDVKNAMLKEKKAALANFKSKLARAKKLAENFYDAFRNLGVWYREMFDGERFFNMNYILDILTNYFMSDEFSPADCASELQHLCFAPLPRDREDWAKRTAWFPLEHPYGDDIRDYKHYRWCNVWAMPEAADRWDALVAAMTPEAENNNN